MVSRYFTNPAKWVNAGGCCNRIVEVKAQGSAGWVHDLTEGTVVAWDYIGRTKGTSALRKALDGVECYGWVELSTQDAWPLLLRTPDKPQTAEGNW